MITICYISIGVIALILGAVLRHLQGGLDNALGIKRWQVVVGYGLLSAPSVYAYWHVPLFGIPDLGMMKAVVMAALFDLDMVLAQDFSKPWKVFWRFGTAPVIAAVITGWYPAVFVGVILGVGTWAVKKWGPLIPLFKPYFDSWEAGWELMIGGVTGCAWALAPLLGHPMF